MPFPAKTSSEQILDAALLEVRSLGADGLSLRQLAQRLGLAPNALYRYFPSRDALMAALADRATGELLDHLAAAARAAGGHGPEALAALGDAYLRFAREHASLYGLVVNARQHPSQGGIPAHERLWAFVLGLLDGAVAPSDGPAAAVALWSYLHGVVELERAAVLRGSKPDASAWGFQALLRGMGAHPQVRSGSSQD